MNSIIDWRTDVSVDIMSEPKQIPLIDLVRETSLQGQNGGFLVYLAEDIIAKYNTEHSISQQILLKGWILKKPIGITYSVYLLNDIFYAKVDKNNYKRFIQYDINKHTHSFVDSLPTVENNHDFIAVSNVHTFLDDNLISYMKERGIL